jgi:hypothetical protein
VDNIRMDLEEVGWGDVDWLVWLRIGTGGGRALVNSVLNLRVSWNAGKLSSGLATGGLWSSAQLHRIRLLIDFTVYHSLWKFWYFMSLKQANELFIRNDNISPHGFTVH